MAIHTNADKANVEGGGHGGEGNLSGGPIEPAVDTPPIVVVPWRLRRITMVWPKLRGNVAAEFRGKFEAANRLGLPNLDLDTMGGGGGFGREAAMGSAPRLNWGGWWCNINWWLPVECPEIRSNVDMYYKHFWITLQNTVSKNLQKSDIIETVRGKKYLLLQKSEIVDVDSPAEVINSWLALLAYSKFVTSWGPPFCFLTFVMFNLAFMINFCLSYERRKLVSCCSHPRENPHLQPLAKIPSQ